MGRPRVSDTEVFVNLRVKASTREALQAAADAECEGNLSKFVRKLLADEAHSIRDRLGIPQPEIL